MIRSGRPPARLEIMQPPWGRESAEVNAYSLNPVLDYLRAVMDRPSFSDEPAPTMFASGDLPPYVATGEDPNVLRWVHWRFRHTAASTPKRSLLYAIVEASAVEGGFLDDGLQSPEGAAAHSEYVGRMWRWAIAPAPSSTVVAPISDESVFAWWNGKLA